MTDPRDTTHEMRNLLLDRDTAQRLLTGRVDPDDAPPGYAGVAALLKAASKLPPVDAARERTTVSAMVEEVRSHLGTDVLRNRRPAAGPFMRAKIVAITVGAMLVGTTGLAFAGALPGPAQGAAHTMLAKFGIAVPDATRDARSDGGTSPAASVAPSTGAQGANSSAHGQAGQPHGQAGQPHGQAGQAHGQAGQPHGHHDPAHHG